MRKSNLTKKVSIESSFSANDLAILFQVSLLTLIIEGFFSLNAALSPLREAQESIRSPRSSTGSQRSHASECSNSSRLDSSSDSRNSAKDLNSNSPYPRPPLIENEKIASHLGNILGYHQSILVLVAWNLQKPAKPQACRHEYDLKMQRGSIFDSLS